MFTPKRKKNMLNTLLIPVDHSNLVKAMIKKLPETIDLSDKTLHLIYVSEPSPPSIYSESSLSEYYINEKAHKDYCNEYADQIFNQYKKLLVTSKQLNFIHTFSNDIPDAIIKSAKKCKADCIVMASHRYTGINNVFLGDKAHKVIVSTKLPVLVL